MVPEAYHPFFGDAAEVAGALIGLLFVAVSVVPERRRAADPGFRMRAGIAFAALTNCLFVTLIAILPGSHLASGGTALGLVGLVSCLWLTWIAARQSGIARRVGALVRTAALVGLFVTQLLACRRLDAHPHDRAVTATVAYLMLGGFAIAIERAWELVGNTGTSALAHLERIAAARRTADPDAEQPDD